MNTHKPKIKPETEYTYTNKFSRKQLRFSPKRDEVIATFQPQTTEDMASAAMRASSLAISQGMNVERGFAVFQVAPGQELEAATRVLVAQPHIANILPVMVDDEGLTRYFLPDEFTVQFREGFTKEEAERMVREKGSQILVQ